MPTPPDQNIPRIRLPVWKWKQPQKGAGQQQPASQAVAPPPTGPQEKTYIIPPYSFSLNFGPFKGHPVSWTGVSAQDLPWAKTTSKVFSWVAAGLDTAALAVSVWDVGASLDLTKATPTAGAVAATYIGGAGTLAVNLADIFGGNTGVVSDGQHMTGIAYGRDSIVAGRNFALGTAAAWAADAFGPGVGTVFGVGGVYVAASQLDYHARGLASGEDGGKVVFRSVTDGAAWSEAWHEVTGHWAAEPELKAAGAAVIGQGLSAVQSAEEAINKGVSAVQSGVDAAGKGISAAGEQLREAAERLGHSAPATPVEPSFKGDGGRSGGSGASGES